MEWRKNLKLTKDPQSVLDYTWDFTNWLAVGDTIVSHSVDADAGITIVSSSNDDQKVTVWIGGGIAGERYTVTVRMTTVQGRTVDRSIIFRIQEQ